MTWSEVSPGVFSKELDGVEKIYRHISELFKPLGREHWGLYFVCDIELGAHLSSKDLTTALRDAWKALRYEFPALSFRPDGLTKKTYVLPDASSVEEWADETFFVDRSTDPDGILASYPARDTPSMHFFPESSQVLFLCSHWRIDGIGTCILMEHFFSLLTAATPSPVLKSRINDLHKISPSLEDALGAPTAETPEIQALAQKKIAEHHKNVVHAGGLPYRGDATTRPGCPTRTAITFNKASTATLIAACKERKITVTSAVYAALATAVFSLSPDEAPEKYAAVMSVNMRSYLEPPYGSKDHAVQVYVTGRSPTVGRDSTFNQKTEHFMAYCKNWCDEEFIRSHRVATRHHYEAMFKRPEGTQPPKPPSSVTLSSLGVIEKNLPSQYGGGAVKLTDFRFGVSMMTRQIMLYVWTFGGRLTFSVNYNDAYHDVAAASGLMEFIRQTLKKEMGVTLQPE
ncbi:hypothetical protein F4677DRAFT_335278 [Hypoxylon crocopeplum]|nr:hypothetical protein F4677DRAFT_335278 [Hypoxylon crocopeplum]